MSDDIKTQSEKDLVKLVLEKREHLREARFNVSGTKIKDVRDQRNTKKDIARILTELRKRSGEQQ